MKMISKLRCIRDFATLAQFVHLFHPYFGFKSFEPELLELELVKNEDNKFLEQLLIQLLRKSFSFSPINSNTLDKSLKKAWARLEVEPFDMFDAKKESYSYIKSEDAYTNQDVEVIDGMQKTESISFFDLGISEKIHVINTLCENSMFYFENISQTIQNEDLQLSWRNEPVGTDSSGRLYWIFNDTRLYRLTEFKKATNAFAPKNEKKSKNSKAGTGRSTLNSRKADISGSSNLKSEKTFSPEDLKAINNKRVLKEHLNQNRTSDELFLGSVGAFSSDSVLGNLEKNGDIWELVCMSSGEWKSFYSNLEKSLENQDIALCENLKDGLLETALKTIKSKERKIKKEEPVVRKRSMRILIKQTAEQEAIEKKQLEDQKKKEREAKAQTDVSARTKKTKFGPDLYEFVIENEINTGRTRVATRSTRSTSFV